VESDGTEREGARDGVVGLVSVGSTGGLVAGARGRGVTRGVTGGVTGVIPNIA
jgi:hypothetical protein